MLRFCLIGHRISYSLSPVIHRKVFSILGIEADYELVDIAPQEFDRKVEELFQKYSGFNVTIPYKVTIARKLTQLSREAEITGAVNTVKVSDRAGYNTDVYGIIYSVKMESLDLSGMTALVLGAGGAARAAVYALNMLGASKIIVCNRTPDRAIELKEHFSRYGIQVEIASWDLRDELAKNADVIINCTPVGTLSWESPLSSSVFRRGQLVIDMVYRPRVTKMLNDALASGARVIDGLRILILQALEADRIWLNINVIREDVYRQVEEEVSRYAQ